MANIVYGKSLNPVGKDNAKSRRNARRAQEAIKAREIEAILAAVLGTEPPARQEELSRAELACKRKPSMQADRVVANAYTQQIESAASKHMGSQIENGMCLPQVAIFAAGYRKSKNIVTAR